MDGTRVLRLTLSQEYTFTSNKYEARLQDSHGMASVETEPSFLRAHTYIPRDMPSYISIWIRTNHSASEMVHLGPLEFTEIADISTLKYV
jgi:hypothetical protein